MKSVCRVVIDTNVFLSALRSRRGASFKLMSLLGTGDFVVCISVPLILEYEAVAQKVSWSGKPHRKAVEDIIDYVCSIGEAIKPSYLWRPIAKDPKDEMLVELAVTGECDRIITYNKRDLRGAEHLGVKLQTPKEFLEDMEK